MGFSRGKDEWIMKLLVILQRVASSCASAVSIHVLMTSGRRTDVKEKSVQVFLCYRKSKLTAGLHLAPGLRLIGEKVTLGQVLPEYFPVTVAPPVLHNHVL